MLPNVMVIPNTVDSMEISFNQSTYNRVAHPDIDNQLEKAWQDKKQTGVHLYDAKKFRLHHFEIVDHHRLKLELGLTTYKDYVGTNLSPCAKGLHQYVAGDQCTLVNGQRFMSDAIGVTALVLVRDNNKDGQFFPILKRSSAVAELSDVWDLPGGHCEPGEVQQFDWNDQHNFIVTMKQGIPATEGLIQDGQKALADELLGNAIIKEIHDELNIPQELILQSDVSLQAILRSNASNGKPLLCFKTTLDVTVQQILAWYKSDDSFSDKFESTDISFVDYSQCLSNLSKFSITSNTLDFVTALVTSGVNE